MARLTERGIKRLQDDFDTGAYTQRQLAGSHDCSVGTVNKYTKGRTPKDKDKVDKIVKSVEVEQETVQKKIEKGIQEEVPDSTQSEKDAIERAVKNKLDHRSLIDTLTKANLRVIAKTISKGTKQVPTKYGVEDVELSPADVKYQQDAIDKAGMTLGVIERYAPRAMTGIQINNPLGDDSDIPSVPRGLNIEDWYEEEDE